MRRKPMSTSGGVRSVLLLAAVGRAQRAPAASTPRVQPFNHRDLNIATKSLDNLARFDDSFRERMRSLLVREGHAAYKDWGRVERAAAQLSEIFAKVAEKVQRPRL